MVHSKTSWFADVWHKQKRIQLIPGLQQVLSKAWHATWSGLFLATLLRMLLLQAAVCHIQILGSQSQRWVWGWQYFHVDPCKEKHTKLRYYSTYSLYFLWNKKSNFETDWTGFLQSEGRDKKHSDEREKLTIPDSLTAILHHEWALCNSLVR